MNERVYKTTEAQRLAAKRWRDKHKEQVDSYEAERRTRILNDPTLLEKRRATLRRSYQKNKIKHNAIRRRFRNTPNAKMADRLRGRLRAAMKHGKHGKKIALLIGCSLEDFRKHIESQFTAGMTWENHGTVWSLDHIRPCCRFDLTTEAGQRECFHYSNTRPLGKRENCIKHSKLIAA